MDFLTEKQMQTLGFKVADLFDQVPMSQIRPILDQAEEILLASHRVQTGNERFKAIAEDYGVSGLFSGSDQTRIILRFAGGKKITVSTSRKNAERIKTSLRRASGPKNQRLP
jgi:hypothetical protein